MDEMNIMTSVEIAPQIYWVGGSGHDGGLHCNPYLIVDGDEAVLIDPGSVLDFDYVLKNVCEIVPLEQVNYVVLHHQDPDFCSSVPLFEKAGAKFRIITHWRTQTLVKYYGIQSDYYIVNEHEYRLVLASGRVLSFIQTPYLHFPGAIVTYDQQTKILFSSDLFGAFSYEWSLYAGHDYMEKMKTFHEHYMPSNDILRPVMEIFRSINISMIAPQHGSIIKDQVIEHIKALENLECGAFVAPVKKELVKVGGYRFLYSSILRRYGSIFSKQEVLKAISGLEMMVDPETLEVADYNYQGHILWNLLFDRIYANQGLSWLVVVEPLVDTLAKEYDLPVPEVFMAKLKKIQEESINLSQENQRLREINADLEQKIKEVQAKMLKCPVTGLYNAEFFKTYLESEIPKIIANNSTTNPFLMIINVDDLARIGRKYGVVEVEQVLRNIAYILNNLKDVRTMLFRLPGASFACFSEHASRAEALRLAETARTAIGASTKFIEPVTVSIGIVFLEEIKEHLPEVEEVAEVMIDIATMRGNIAKTMGMNLVCSDSSWVKPHEARPRILLTDSDTINIDVLRTLLENLEYQVEVAYDGEEALQIAESKDCDLIISEVLLPKMDGFVFREKLLAQSTTKNIPFLFVSHLKDDDSVQRAMDLGVEYYFKKPFMLSELFGVVKNKTRGEA